MVLLWLFYNLGYSVLAASLPRPLLVVLGLGMYLTPVRTVTTMSVLVHTGVGMLRSTSPR